MYRIETAYQYTTGMPRSHFKPHGQFKPSVEGQVLIAHCWGSWNIEMHQESALQSKPLVEALNAKGPWGCITVVHESLVTSLAVLQAGRDAVAQRSTDLRIVALAWVLTPDLEGYSFLMNRYEAMYEGLIDTKVFDSISAAQNWIEAVIASKPKDLAD